MSAGAKESKQTKTVTDWREEARPHQQGQKSAGQQRHSHPREKRTGSVSRGKREQASRGTNILERGGYAASAEEKESKQRH